MKKNITRDKSKVPPLFREHYRTLEQIPPLFQLLETQKDEWKEFFPRR